MKRKEFALMHSDAIIRTEALSDRQLRQIRDLVTQCARHDGSRSEYPLDTPGQIHWLLYSGNNSVLKAVCTLIPLDDDTVECCAFTRPASRQPGCFLALLEQAEKEAEDRDILFFAGQMPDTLATLHAISAEKLSTEHQMEKELPPPASYACHDKSESNTHDRTWKLTSACDASAPTASCQTVPIASCQTTPVGEACVCLHHVEVCEPFRQKGFATALLTFLFSVLASEGVRRILLHVSDDNLAAIALYKKTGFRITETLSTYLY
ncbi:MAG: GNAT family N-acetyltransferase [Clostridiales bacterium]|nr:GNAT family N-acetyltransferase [Clostridiales bacterium]